MSRDTVCQNTVTKLAKERRAGSQSDDHIFGLHWVKKFDVFFHTLFVRRVNKVNVMLVEMQ